MQELFGLPDRVLLNRLQQEINTSAQAGPVLNKEGQRLLHVAIGRGLLVAGMDDEWDVLRAEAAGLLQKLNVPEAAIMSLRPCVGYVPDEDGVGQLGGTPWLDCPWPRNIDGKPLAFLAQFDAADLPDAAWQLGAPKKGLLTFFCDVDYIANTDDFSQMASFYEEYNKDNWEGVIGAGRSRVFLVDFDNAEEADFPDDLDDVFRYRMATVSPILCEDASAVLDVLDDENLTIESWLAKDTERGLSILQEENPEADEDLLEAIYEDVVDVLYDIFDRPTGDEAGHKLLGRPEGISDEILGLCPSKECHYPEPVNPVNDWRTETVDGWRLLAQLETDVETLADDGTHVNLDFKGGTIYYYIRNDDFAAGRFDRVWTIFHA